MMYDYAYDPIGNRLSATEYAESGDALVSAYSANALNQYTSRTVPGTAQVRGFADSDATVTVNGNGTWRSGEYFYGGDDADNTALPVFKEVAIEAVRPAPTPDDYDEVAAVTGRVFVAQNPEQFTYDADGNMTCDGRFRYTWNAENRLVRAQELCAPTNRHPYTITYAYDHRGRMVTKRITENDGTDTLVKSITYLWDGWNVIRETVTNPSTLQPFNSSTDYVWGLDLNGTLQGAGGVGGLLAVVRDDGVFLPTYDANGNISEYVTTNGEIVAHYDYSPFGETLIETGDLASTFTHRFSTKPWCPITGLYEYQMRKYRPGIGRWLSRDPIGERKDIPLYVNSGNRLLNVIDPMGLFSKEFDGNIVTVTVGACEIVVLDGHGHKRIPHRFVFPQKTCSGGCFIGCYPDVTNGLIPTNNIVPGAPFEPGVHYDYRGGDIWDFRKRVLEGAKNMARQFCEKECCEQVTLIFTSTIKPPRFFDWFAQPPRKDTVYTFDCSTQKWKRQPGGQDNYPIYGEENHAIW